MLVNMTNRGLRGTTGDYGVQIRCPDAFPRENARGKTAGRLREDDGGTARCRGSGCRSFSRSLVSIIVMIMQCK